MSDPAGPAAPAEGAALQLMALKFELAMSIGESLEIGPMVRRFMVPLLQAVQGLNCLLWLRGDDGVALRMAYPQRSLAMWDGDTVRHAWLQQTVAAPAGTGRQLAHGGSHLHALPVADEGWLFVERAAAPVPAAVLDAITVVLRRLARACRACHEHARARQLLAEKEAAERALREANARMAEIFSLSSDGFVYFDTHGRLAFCNPAVEDLLGLETAQIMGLTLAELDARLACACSAAPALAEKAAVLQGAASCSGTVDLVRPQRRIVAFTLSRTDDDSRAVLYLRDVTRETEVDRMKSEFLTTAAHELRTPMVSVFGFTELLLRRPVPEAQRRDMLETIHRQALLLIKMVNELLDLARIEARQGADLKREAVEIGPLVRDTVAALCLGAETHAIELELTHDREPLWIDPAKTAQALSNVLSNAVKYSPPGTRICVRTLDGWVDEAPAIGLRVVDEGIGMSPEQVARVFERFYRADASGNIPGTGLGMSLVKEIVELQDGRVTVDSRLAKGTTVTLWLPLALESAQA